MRDKKEFYSVLMDFDGKPANEASGLIGDFDFSRYVLKINQIKDAESGGMSLVMVRVPQTISAFPPHLFNSPVRRTAVEDYLTRQIVLCIKELEPYSDGGAARPRLAIAEPGQKILPRTAVLVTEEFVEARVYVRIPTREGLLSASAIRDLFFTELPAVVNNSLIFCNLEEDELESSVDLMEDADQIRQMLSTRGLVSFVAEGSQLARMAYTDEPDIEADQLITMPESLVTTIDVPNAGVLRGLGVPAGITVVLGDDYSGRPEFSRALAAGIYNHVQGDGRELVVTVPDAVYVAAEPGRSVQRVDISAFVKGEGAEELTQFSTDEADACTAQAVTLVETLEMGARVLILDELDSASSFLSIDARVEGLLESKGARIQTLASRARQLVDELGVSMVISGSNAVTEFIPHADTVLLVDDFHVRDITQEARELGVEALVCDRDPADFSTLVQHNRWVVPSSIDPSMGPHDAFINTPEADLLQFGDRLIDLSGIIQVAEESQVETIGLIMYYAKLRYMDEGRPLREILDLVDRDLSTEGLECLTRDLRGNLARPRRYEIAAALNRLESLRISHIAE